MNIFNVNSVVLSVLFGMSSISLALAQTPQVRTGQASKVTLSSLLAKTIKASQETQAIFDEQQLNEPVSNIEFPPEIDISYDQAVNDLDNNIGANVRWGGHVIESETINDLIIRLTVYAYPLTVEGRPIETQSNDDEGGRFIVNLTNGLAQGVNLKGHYLTFYGDIRSGFTIKNGKREKEIPMINALEFVDWNVVDENKAYVENQIQPRNSYYLLSHRNGHFTHYYSPYYSSHYYRNSVSRRHSSLVGLGFTDRQFSIHRQVSSPKKVQRSRSFSNNRFHNSRRRFGNKHHGHRRFKRR